MIYNSKNTYMGKDLEPRLGVKVEELPRADSLRPGDQISLVLSQGSGRIHRLNGGVVVEVLETPQIGNNAVIVRGSTGVYKSYGGGTRVKR